MSVATPIDRCYIVRSLEVDVRWLPILALLAGCDSDVTFSGYPLSQYFPFDGQRTWEYVSTDASIPYKLVSTLDSNHTEGADGELVYAVSTSSVCPDEGTCGETWVRSLEWSADPTNGTRIHSLETPSGTTTFDPPLQLTQGTALVGDVLETTTAGHDYTATFVGLDHCPVVWTDQWGDQCVHLTLEDGGANTELAGDWWAITQYNVVAFALTGDTGTWQLSYASFDN